MLKIVVSGISVRNNEIKDIIKVIRSLYNRGKELLETLIVKKED